MAFFQVILSFQGRVSNLISQRSIEEGLNLKSYHVLYSSYLAFIKHVQIFKTIHKTSKLIMSFSFLAQKPIPYNAIILYSRLAVYSTQWCVRVKMPFIKPNLDQTPFNFSTQYCKCQINALNITWTLLLTITNRKGTFLFLKRLYLPMFKLKISKSLIQLSSKGYK